MAPVKSKVMLKGRGRVAIGFEHEVEVKKGSKGYAALAAALAAEEPQDADMYLSIKDNLNKELAQAYINLQDLLAEGGKSEKVAQKLIAVHDKKGNVGHMIVTVEAIQALQMVHK